MKIIACRLLILFITLFGVVDGYAAPSPPMPGAKRPPPPPGLPIDENIFALLIIAVFLGIYIIYRHQLKTKAPI